MSKTLALDVETSFEGNPTLDWWKADIDLLSYKVGTEPVKTYPNPKEFDLSEFKGAYNDPSVIIIGHGVKFDILCLTKLGYEVPIKNHILDTSILSTLYDNRGSHRLKDLSEKILGRKVVRLEDLLIDKEGKKRAWKDAPMEEKISYNSQDVELCYELSKHYTDSTRLDERIKKRYELEEQILKVLIQAELEGIKIDFGSLAFLLDDFKNRIDKIEGFLKSNLGDVDWNSPKQLSEYFFKSREPLKLTDKGKPSVDESVLKKLSISSKIAADVLAVRRIKKWKSTYLDNYSLYADSNGVIHPAFYQNKYEDDFNNFGGTETSRFSSSRPNVQNIPEHSEARIIKSVFIPRDGNKFVSVDFSQIELRFLAHYSKDPVLMDAFKRGVDMHSSEAREIFEVKTPTPTQRFIGKTFNFALGFGAWEDTLMEALEKELPPEEFEKITKQQLSQLIHKYWLRHRILQQWMGQVKSDVSSKGYVETILGYRRYFDNPKSMQSQREAINAIPQGSAADLMRLTIIKLNESGLPYKFRNFIHDEIVCEVPDKVVNKAAFTMKKISLGCMKLNVPIRVKVKVGGNFEELK